VPGATRCSGSASVSDQCACALGRGYFPGDGGCLAAEPAHLEPFPAWASALIAVFAVVVGVAAWRWWARRRAARHHRLADSDPDHGGRHGDHDHGHDHDGAGAPHLVSDLDGIALVAAAPPASSDMRPVAAATAEDDAAVPTHMVDDALAPAPPPDLRRRTPTPAE